MLSKKNLRNRVVVFKESNEDLKKSDIFSSKCKLDEKENLRNSDLTEQYSFKCRKKNKSLHQSPLKNLNKPVTSIINEIDSHEDTFGDLLPQKENVCERPKRQVKECNSPENKISILKERNLRNRIVVLGNPNEDSKKTHFSSKSKLGEKEEQLKNSDLNGQYEFKENVRERPKRQVKKCNSPENKISILKKRNLRNRVVVLGNPNEDSKKTHFSAKSKLGEKEEQLKNSDLNGQCEFKETKKNELAYQSTLKNLNEPVTVIVNENNCDNKPPTKGNIRERSKKQVEKYSLCKDKLLKENNSKTVVDNVTDVKNKTPLTLAVKKQKKNIKKVNVDSEDVRLKLSKRHNAKIHCHRIEGQPEKYSNQENVCIKENSSKTKVNVIKHNTNIPIWKKYLNLSKNNPCIKRHSKCNGIKDVYDISLDEEIMSSKVEVKKKNIHSKKDVNKNVLKKKRNIFCKKDVNKNVFNKKYPIVPTKIQKSKKKYSLCNNSVSNEQRPLLKVDGPALNIIDRKPTVVEIDKNYLPSDKSMKNIVCDFDDENKRQNQFPAASVQTCDLNEILEHSDLDLQSLEPKYPNNKFLSTLADELEKSFMMPMTSTPDTVHVKNEVQVPKGEILKISDISNISAINKHCLKTTVTTPCDSSSDDHLIKNVVENLGDITLFESPTKMKEEKKIKFNSPKKSIQINLFEVLNSSCNKHNLEDSVLKSQKAYHTPDNFKTHLIRTKRASEVTKKQIKKSKTDILMEKMALHFDEIGGTELCIE